jgi:hypothetical protein
VRNLRRVHDVGRVKALASEALSRGGERVGVAAVSWDIGERCERPVFVSMTGRPSDEGSKWYAWLPGKEHSFFVDMTVRCRQCPPCLRMRSRLWAARCAAEISSSERTWFGTLTLSAEEQYRASVIAGGTSFGERHSAISEWLTLYLKRVRKQSGARFRYCLVGEAHKSGLPHYHMLLHERDAGSPVRYRTLQGQWPHGFSNWKVAEHGAADGRLPWYIAKYLAKSALVRIRASKDYGAPQDLRRIADGLVP